MNILELLKQLGGLTGSGGQPQAPGMSIPGVGGMQQIPGTSPGGLGFPGATPGYGDVVMPQGGGGGMQTPPPAQPQSFLQKLKGGLGRVRDRALPVDP